MMSDLFLAFEIGGKRAAIPSQNVQSIIALENLTPVPKAPEHIVGLTSVRSRVLTVVDPSKLLGLAKDADAPAPAEQHAVVMEFAGHGYALLVDAILDVTQAMGETGAAPDDLGAEWARAATGTIETAHGPLLVLDAEALVTGVPLPMAA